MFSRQRRKVKILYGLADVILIAAAFEAAYQTRLHLELTNIFFIVPPVKALLLGAAMLGWPLVGAWLNVYDHLDAARPRAIFRDAFKQCAFGTVGIVLIEYTLRLDLSRPFLALLAAYGFVALCLFRLGSRRLFGWMRRGLGAPYYILLVGTGPRARRMAEQVEASSDFGARLVGFLAAEPDAPGDEIRLEKAYPVHPLAALPELLARQIIDEVIFAVDSRRLGEMEDTLLMCDEEGVRSHVAADFFPHVYSRVFLEKFQTTPLLTFSATPQDEVALMIKRVTDVVVAATSLVVLAPLMLLTAVLIRATSPGPAIFRQLRCGLSGRRFTLYKFRSMCQDAEARKASLQHLNPKQTVFKIPNDPRLTPIGRYLRKFSVDEWPQLWNVLKGDMSLVGPRPPVPEEVEQYRRWQRRRLRMRPGLTCLWALEGRDSLDFETWMRKDMEYIDNWSLPLDLSILLRTIPRVLSGKGAH